MKQSQPDVDSIPRWRDRPAGGTSDEDRAAGLTREGLAPGALSDGLDDRELQIIAGNLKAPRRPRPPFWLRPAIVAALVSMSMASVMGYQAGWFAPLRERLRFRSIPPATPEPAEHARKRVSMLPPAPAREPPPAPPEDPPAEAAAAESAPQDPAPVAARAPVAKKVPVQKVATADTPPPAAPAVARVEPSPAAEEIEALEDAMGLLRGKHDARAALGALNGYLARFPKGLLAREARVARIDALLMLDRADEALGELDTLPLDAHRRSTELQLIRAELRARTDCGRAEADFTAVLARVRTPALEERALYGRAACRTSAKNARGAADDLRRYVDRFPNGSHADWARRWLENSQ